MFSLGTANGEGVSVNLMEWTNGDGDIMGAKALVKNDGKTLFSVRSFGAVIGINSTEPSRLVPAPTPPPPPPPPPTSSPTPPLFSDEDIKVIGTVEEANTYSLIVLIGFVAILTVINVACVKNAIAQVAPLLTMVLGLADMSTDVFFIIKVYPTH